MQPHGVDDKRRERKLGEERRLQTGAALLLGLLVLLVMVLRSGVHNVFASGWWRH